MKRIRSFQFAAAFTFVAAGLILASCGTPPRTELDDSVASHCLETENRAAGYRMACTAAPGVTACVPSRQARVQKAAADSAAICAKNPADTEANRKTLRALRDVVLGGGRL